MRTRVVDLLKSLGELLLLRGSPALLPDSLALPISVMAASDIITIMLGWEGFMDEPIRFLSLYLMYDAVRIALVWSTLWVFKSQRNFARALFALVILENSFLLVTSLLDAKDVAEDPVGFLLNSIYVCLTLWAVLVATRIWAWASERSWRTGLAIAVVHGVIMLSIAVTGIFLLAPES